MITTHLLPGVSVVDFRLEFEFELAFALPGDREGEHALGPPECAAPRLIPLPPQDRHPRTDL